MADKIVALSLRGVYSSTAVSYHNIPTSRTSVLVPSPEAALGHPAVKLVTILQVTELDKISF